MDFIQLCIDSNLSLSQLGLPNIDHTTGCTKKIKPDIIIEYHNDIDNFLRGKAPTTEVGSWLKEHFDAYDKLVKIGEFTIPICRINENSYDLGWIVCTSDWIYSKRAVTILSYFTAYFLSSEYNIKKIMYILPCSHELLEVDFDLNEYNQEGTLCNIVSINKLWMQVGSHVSSGKNVVESLSQRKIAVYQIFISAPQSGRILPAEEEMIKVRNFITEKGKLVYVHAPYTLNVSGNTQQAYEVLCKHMDAVSKMNMRGLVFHVGKSKESDGLDKMRETIIKVLEQGFPCDLILETPAGQGNELLVDRSDFVNFHDSIYKKYKNFKICIDTCHIFAAGTEFPINYFQDIEPPRIALIHLNDSRTPCGSHLDRHAWRGRGHIGLDKLYQVVEYAVKNGIHMVNE